MDQLRQIADRLDDAAATLTEVAYAVTATDPAHPAFGAGAAGRLGEIGRALHRQWCAATAARAREATETAARITTTADAVRIAGSRYADADQAVRHRQSEVW